MSQQPWIGTWRLLSCQSRNDTGETRLTYGENPFGRLQYDPVGNMSALLSRRDRPPLPSADRFAASAAEIQASLRGFLAYCGTYEFFPADGYALHRVQGSSIPNWVGGVQKRFYVLDGSRLTITTPPIPARGDEWVSVLVWEKLAGEKIENRQE